MSQRGFMDVMKEALAELAPGLKNAGPQVMAELNRLGKQECIRQVLAPTAIFVPSSVLRRDFLKDGQMPCSIFSKVRWWGAGRRALVVLLASIAVLPNLSAAAAPAQPAAGDDLRAAFATPQDIAEGKRVALASCASCHAITGIALAKGTPHIAGQRPAYLYAELRVYQAGRRGDNPMNNVVKFLSDDALVKVSAYYASLDPAQTLRYE